MEWNNGYDLTPNFVFNPPPQSSSALFYNYNYNFDQFTAVETPGSEVETEQGADQKKRRFSRDQLEALERSFGEDQVKLEPDRKMKLSKELGLEPKQIAVWFQNRRARWKAKQLEHLYKNLKEDFDTISRENHNLQQEVMQLRSMLREQAARNQVLMGYRDVYGEDAGESTSGGVRGCNNNHIFNGENVNQIISTSSAPPFLWGAEASAHLPFYPLILF